MTTAIPEDAAKIVFHNDVYHVYRPDGFYAKEVMTARTRYGAEKFCHDNGWTIVGGSMEYEAASRLTQILKYGR